MSDFLMDKAFMALKAKRYEEAQSTYEKILEQGYTVPAWCGLGSCKMFQLADGQTLEEVVYCYNKAYSLPDAKKLEIDKHLIENVNVVLTQYASYAIAGIKNAIQAEKDLQKAALVGLASIAVGSMANSQSIKMISGVAAGAAGAVAIGKFGEMKDMKEIAKYCIDMLSVTHSQVKELLLDNNNIEEAIILENNVSILCNEIYETLPEKIRLIVQSKELQSESFEDLTDDISKLPISSKYNIPARLIYKAAVNLKKQSELGLFGNLRPYILALEKEIKKPFEIGFIDWGGFSREIKKSKISESEKWQSTFPEINADNVLD